MSPSSTDSRGRSSRCGACRRCTRCPGGRRIDRGARFVLQLAHELDVPGPALVLVHQDDVERGGVGTPVVGRVRAFLEGGQLAVAPLVEDASRVLVSKVVEPCPLARPEGAQRGGGQVGSEGQRLEAGEDGVASEHGHEPRQARGRQGVPGEHGGDESQRGEVDQISSVLHWPWALTVVVNVRPFSSTAAGEVAMIHVSRSKVWRRYLSFRQSFSTPCS